MFSTIGFQARSVMKTKENLDTIVDKVQRQAKRESLRKASTPMRKRAAQNARKRSGLLSKSLIIKVKTFKQGKEIISYIGPNRSIRGEYEGKEVWPVKYAHLIEFGHDNVPASPYMRPAFDSTKEESLRIYAEDIKQTIKRVGNRFRDKYKL